MAEALMDELVEEVLLRIAPDDPALLVHAALVCRRWRRLIRDPSFRRRFREFHRRRPPMLGFLCNIRCDAATSGLDAFIDFLKPSRVRARFVPAASSSVARPADRDGWQALDSRQGRVLLHTSPWVDDKVRGEISGMSVCGIPSRMSRWICPGCRVSRDPFPYGCGWNAAVLCAAAGGGGCVHLACHFLVVFVGCYAAMRMFTRIYSSESGTWSEVAFAKSMPIHGNGDLQLDQPVLAENALYFLFQRPDGILKYDLATEKMSEIELPDAIGMSRRIVLTNTEDGVGFALVEGRSRLCLWSWEAGSDKGASRWTQTKVIELKTILPTVNWLSMYAHVLGSADGLGLIFVWTTIGLLTVDPKSDQVRNLGHVGEGSRIYNIIPHISFCTPVFWSEIRSGAQMHENQKYLSGERSSKS